MTTLFISDLHLQQERPEITRAFFDFLVRHANHAHQLYILGDFFEVWVGDDGITPFHQQIIDCLARLSETCEIYFMHGNRDFLIGDHFADLTGITILNDPTVISLYGTQTLLLHGDSLCTSDQAYMQFRQMVRDPSWQQNFLSKPLAERLAIAKELRERSRQETAEKEEYITDVTPQAVTEAMESHGCSLMIHGHTHRPARHHVNLDQVSGERIVLGDWDHNGWYLSADPESIELQQLFTQ